MNGADDQFEKSFLSLSQIKIPLFRYNLNVIDHLNEPYDYASIMHYGPYAFSGSGKKTIIPRKVSFFFKSVFRYFKGLLQFV